MNQEQQAKWKRTRSKGMWRFVLLRVLVFGGAMFVATSLFDYFVDGRWPGLEKIGIRGAIFLITGLAAGVALWLFTEHRYRKGS